MGSLRRFAHCGTGLEKGRAVRLDHTEFGLIRNHNPLALYELSATLPSSPHKSLGSGMFEVNRKIPFCVGVLVLVGLVTVGTTPSEAAVAARAKTTKSAKAAAAKRATVYSAERSQSRKVKLAVARARATAREMTDTV